MAWRPNDLQLSGRGKEKPNSAIHLKSLTRKVCEEGAARGKDYMHKNGRRLRAEGSVEETPGT